MIIEMTEEVKVENIEESIVVPESIIPIKNPSQPINITESKKKNKKNKKK